MAAASLDAIAVGSAVLLDPPARATFRVCHFSRWDVDEHLATFLCVLTHASRRVGYGETTSPAKQRINRGFDKVFSNRVPPGPARHEVLRNLAIVEALGGTVSDDTLEVRLTERDRRRAAKLLAPVTHSSKLVAIGIGAHSPGRRWPLERYAETVLQLANEYSIYTVVVCSAAERGEAEILANFLPGDPIIVSGAPIREVCAVLERCDLFLGNDSGCAHLAAAANCKTIVISRHPRDGDPNHFNSPVRFAPHGSCVSVLQPTTGLDGCEAACRRSEPHCITSVAVESVVATARKMLESPRVIAVPLMTSSWPEQVSSHLIHSHSAVAMQHAIAALRFQQTKTPPPPS